MKNLMIYYGYLNSFGLYFDNEKAAQDLARYNLLVFGDGVQDPTHPDYSNAQIIIDRIKVLNPAAEIFGYVTVNQAESAFRDKVDDWDDMGVHGIFLDEAGYDFGTASTNGREAFNDKCDYVHSRDSANVCFANAWNPNHVLSTVNDPSYPNTTWNPSEIDTALTEDDWYLMESHAIKTDKNYEDHSQWKSRGDKISVFIGSINIAAVSIVDDADPDGQDKFDFVYRSALMWDFDAVGVSDTSFGASSGKGHFWDRSPVGDIGNCDVNRDGTTERYLGYYENARITIDFKSTQEDSTLELY